MRIQPAQARSASARVGRITTLTFTVRSISRSSRPDRLARRPQDRVGRRQLIGRAVGVPQVGVPGDQRQRLPRAGAADEDGDAILDRPRGADGLVEPVEAALVRHGLAVQEPADQRHGLAKAVQAFAEARPEVEPERLVLAGEPARAQAQDRSVRR